VENLWAVGVPPRTPLGELTAPPDSLTGGEGACCSLPKNPTPLSIFVSLFLAPQLKNLGMPWNVGLLSTSRRHLMQLLHRSWLAAVVETRSTDTINCLLSTYRYEFQSQRCHRTVGVASCQIAPRNRRKMAKFETETKCVAARRKNCSQLFSFA